MLSSQDIRELALPFLEKEKTHLCDVKVSGRAGKPLIQLFIDWEENNITVDACAKISREIQDLIDMQDGSPADYQLIVSSPGIDCPLQQLWQFRKNIGRLIRWNDAEGTVEGRLIEVEEDGIIRLDVKGNIREFSSDQLTGARVVIEISGRNKTKRKHDET